MKNTAAILLLLVFLFNFAGYRLFFFYADRQADESFASMVDRGNYRSSALTTIAVPLNMPYISEHGFEKAEGEITLQGKVYKYVSRAVRNDSLILRCLPDLSRTTLAEARMGFYGQPADNQLPGKKMPEHTRKFLQDNDFDFLIISPASAHAASGSASGFRFFSVAVPSGPALSQLQPPDCSSAA